MKILDRIHALKVFKRRFVEVEDVEEVGVSKDVINDFRGANVNIGSMQNAAEMSVGFSASDLERMLLALLQEFGGDSDKEASELLRQMMDQVKKGEVDRPSLLKKWTAVVDHLPKMSAAAEAVDKMLKMAAGS